MIKYIFHIVSVFLLYGCSYQNRTNRYFENKSLLYSEITRYGESEWFEQIIEKRGDSIYISGLRMPPREEWKAWASDTVYYPGRKPDTADFTPYKYYKKGKAIILSYKRCWPYKDYRYNQYIVEHLGRTDAIDYRYRDEQTKGYTEYQKDTVIKVGKRKFRCWVFREFYHSIVPGFDAVERTHYSDFTTYIEKSSFIQLIVSKGEFSKLFVKSIISADTLRKYVPVKNNIHHCN